MKKMARKGTDSGRLLAATRLITAMAALIAVIK
jgi:hypothetical protein